MSVAPIETLKSKRWSDASSTSLVISKETGLTLVNPDGEKLPDQFEYVKPKKSTG